MHLPPSHTTPIPAIGLGTWELRGEECTRVVEEALELGYQHIDTAHVYQNHASIRQAIKGVDRKKIYITSKIAVEEQVDPAHCAFSVEKACHQTLKELGLDFLDLYLIHAPNRDFPLERIFQSLETLVSQGKILKAGVSNYTIHHLEDLRLAGSTPFANQVEFHPYLYQKELLDYCSRHHIQLISYRSFGKGRLLEKEPLFTRIGSRYGKTGAQVVLRWLIQKNICVIPKASSRAHLQQNLDIFDFALTPEEMTTLDHLHQGKRFCKPDNPEFNY